MSLCPVGTQVQTLIFPRPRWTLAKARCWARSNGFHVRKVDKTKHSFRVRQRPPSAFRTGSFRTIDFAHGIKAVIGCPKD